MSASFWQSKVCVVTGASAGLGLSIARAFAARRAIIVINARNEESLDQAAESLRSRGGEVLPVTGDVTSSEDVDRLAETVLENYPRVDLLCNCAGRSTRGELLDTTPEQFEEFLEVNFLSAVRMTRAFAPALLKQQGHIVNVGSLASKVAPRFMGAYPAGKFALAAYSQQLRLELGPQGLHVLLVCPGPILRTETEPRYTKQAENLPAEARRPGAGATLKGIDPDWLAEKILRACERRKPELVVPGKARLLLGLSQFSPSLGDWLLRRSTSGR